MKASIVRTAIVLLIAVAAPWFGPGLGAQQASTCYETWWPSGNRSIELEICEYDRGTSGFIVLRNESRSTYDVCWTLEFDDDTTNRGCYSGLRAGAESTSSCFKCNRRGAGGGVVNVIFRRADPKAEDALLSEAAEVLADEQEPMRD